MDKNGFIYNERYQLAEKRVKKLKGFYSHVLVFIVINLIIVVFNIRNLSDGESYFQWHNFFTFSIWGMILLSHMASVFLPNLIFGKNWESRRIKKYMDNDDNRWE